MVRTALFEGSELSFLQALNNSEVPYDIRPPQPGVIMASSSMIIIGQTAAIAASIATVIVAWIKARSSRKIILTLNNKQVIHAEGYSTEEIKELWEHTSQMMVIETLSVEKTDTIDPQQQLNK